MARYSDHSDAMNFTEVQLEFRSIKAQIEIKIDATIFDGANHARKINK